MNSDSKQIDLSKTLAYHHDQIKVLETMIWNLAPVNGLGNQFNLQEIDEWKKTINVNSCISIQINLLTMLQFSQRLSQNWKSSIIWDGLNSVKILIGKPLLLNEKSPVMIEIRKE